MEPATGLLVLESILRDTIPGASAAQVVASVNWASLLKAGARRESPLFEEFKPAAAAAVVEARKEPPMATSDAVFAADVQAELESIVAGVIGSRVAPQQPLMEVRSPCLLQM